MALPNAVSPVISAHRPGTLSLEFSTTRETTEVCHDLRSPSKFHAALLALDTRTIEEHRAMRCPACAGPLCRSDYPRKAWGVDARARPLYARRFSLCCIREGCRVRVTPPSARFLGRRRYPVFWVLGFADQRPVPAGSTTALSAYLRAHRSERAHAHALAPVVAGMVCGYSGERDRRFR